MPHLNLGWLERAPYTPPPWTDGTFLVPPAEKVRLGMLPTPLHRWSPPGAPEGARLWIKRDDLSGMQLSGNKVRKLEFLMAEAQQRAADCVLTIGGIQSNHCRATAAAAAQLGLGCHLILRTSRAAAEQDPGLTGNLLVDRLAGAHCHLVTKEEYSALGSGALLTRLAAQLEAAGARPYVIPVGGSSPLGAWGYLQAMEEVRQQSEALGVRFDDIVMATGSGGTASGVALGARLSGLGARVFAYGVCDTPDYFYDHADACLQQLAGGRGAPPPARTLFTAVQARGSGYAISTEAELQTICDVSRATGILLDPVYSGKALHHFFRDAARLPAAAWAGRDILFLHTGGLLGLYDKAEQLQARLQAGGSDSRVSRMDLAA